MRRCVTGALGLMALPAVASAAEEGVSGRLVGLASPVLLGLSIVLAGVGFTAGMVVTQVVVPALIRRSALLARRTPGRCLVYGLLVTLVVLLGLILSRAIPSPLGRLLAIALVLPHLALTLIGLATASYSVGESVLAASGSSHEGAGPWATGTGAGLLAASNLLPIFGQAVLLIAMLAGMGAALRQLLTRRASPAVVVADEPPATAPEAAGRP